MHTVGLEIPTKRLRLSAAAVSRFAASRVHRFLKMTQVAVRCHMPHYPESLQNEFVMSPQPAREANELLAESIAVYDGFNAGSGNDLALQRTKNRVEAHLRKLPGDYVAITAKGILQAAVDDLGAIQTVEGAVARAPHDATARLNFITALTHFGYFDRALSQARHAWDLGMRDSAVVERLIRYSFMNGLYADVRAWQKQWRELFSTSEIPSLDQMELIAPVLEEHPNVDTGAIGEYLAIATELAREKGFAPSVSELEVHRDDDNQWLSLAIGLKADTDLLVSLELELTDRVSYTDLVQRLGGFFVIEFEPLKTTARETTTA